MNAANLVIMAYARLVGLKASLEQRKSALPTAKSSREFIDDYHDIVTGLESLGVELAQFKIPPQAIHHSGGTSWCDLDFLISKVGGLLNLFTISDDKTEIGFISHP